jgi:hypothetical protein
MFSNFFWKISLQKKKNSEIYQHYQKYFPEDFSMEDISPGKLSGIFRSVTPVYSRKIILFCPVVYLYFLLWQVARVTKKLSEKFSESFRKHRSHSEIKMWKTTFTAGKLYFFMIKFFCLIFPKFFEICFRRKKFPRFNKIVRNIFRRIFLRRKFPGETFPEFSN